ncbi:hypothetical protein QWY85_02170 [Neolewinella lacunae]|uniref:Uncharacterized protein n=1 Tax=Neolewinella lacunae TaxID=1517758 RepID=A0A923PNG7_9BACT|nr:hypothetical protein [Neolewinella lacunae]MBC6996689.1 hypothetical protein [Neolewinella lacunae]MDN3633446.1 hypothetical protein [Neolewinella lacunae]
MKISKTSLCLLAALFLTTLASCACEEDEFGDVLEMEIPVDIGRRENIYQVGDTLWVVADFPKFVKVVGNQNDIELVDHKFFSSLYISLISESQLRTYTTSQVIVERGSVEINQLGGYDYLFEETEFGYAVRFGIVLVAPGDYSTTSISGEEQGTYRHPTYYSCKNNLRKNVFINRINRFSTMDNFNDFLAWDQVAGDFVQTYEGYLLGGKFTFRVVE